MNLARTTALSGLAVATRLAGGLMLTKVISIHVGPAGFGLLGQFQSVVMLLATAAGGAFAPGVTKLTAEFAGQPARQRAVWRTVLMLSGALTTLCALLLLLAARPLAAWLLGGAALAIAFFVLAATLALIALNLLLLAVLGGLKKVWAYVAASIAGTLVGTAVGIGMVLYWGLTGALAAVAVGQAAGALPALWFATRVARQRSHRSMCSQWHALVGPIDRGIAVQLLGFAGMAVTSAAVVPLAQIAIRDGITRLLGADVAGLWQAMWKISETHLTLLTTTLSLYFLPRFAEVVHGDELLEEVRAGYRFVLPLVLATAAVAWLGRDLLVRLLFTRDFLPLTEALGWQLVGDVLKIASCVPAYTMISHARTRLFIASEIVFAGVVTAACLAGADAFGLRGVAMGYALTYMLYWVVVHCQVRALARRLDVATVRA